MDYNPLFLGLYSIIFAEVLQILQENCNLQNVCHVFN